MNSKSAIAILTEIEEGLTENQKKIHYIMKYIRPNKTKPEDKDGWDLVKDQEKIRKTKKFEDKKLKNEMII